MSEQVEQTLAGAFSHYKNGKYDVAEQWVGNILAPNPFHVRALHLGAMIAAERKDIKTALARLQTAMGKAPKDPELYNTLGNVHLKNSDATRAEMAFNGAINIASDMIAPRQNLAFMLLRENQPAEALTHFDTLVKMQPDNANFAIGRIYALKDSGQAAAASSALDALGEGRMNKGQGALLKTQLAADMGQVDKTAAHARSAYLENDALGAQALSVAVQSMAMSGDAAGALSTAFEALGEDRSGVRIVAAAGKALDDLGHREDSAKALISGAAKFDNAPEILAAQAQIALGAGNASKAYEMSRQALSTCPGDLSIMPIFARAALASGHIEDAMVAAHSALAVTPNDQFWIAVKATAGRLKGQDYSYYYNYDKFVRVYDLSAPAGYDDIAAFNAALSKALGKLHNYKSAPLDQSLRFGTQTHQDLRFSNDPVITAFFRAIDAPIRDYMDTVGQAPVHPLTRRNSGNYRLAGAWSVRLTAGGHHVNHVHPQGWVSSSYYVDVPDEVADAKTKSGWIGFGAPPLDIPAIAIPEKIIQPKPGRLVLFPSYMWHGTLPISGDQPRLTLPFDVVPAP
ncbi:putative 2OG-Fe(II) oxygenase [Robiginitomaculum antarcticum]|uniref:putative 2OG-Fe(II) oxygenase n=1 Tax=Robiginitomaculum antarcticum TaxID=437507 RepID=UPI000363828C|nr:putative 2OG-Fe(II) oxygenase [Robiginitomaculum antarcticum]